MVVFTDGLNVVCEMMEDNKMSLGFSPKQVEEWYCDLLTWAKIKTSGMIRVKNLFVLDILNLKGLLAIQRIIELGSWLYGLDV